MTLGKQRFTVEQTCGSVSVAVKWSRAIGTGQAFNAVLSDFQNLVGAATVQDVRQVKGIDRVRLVARQETSAGKLFARAPRSFASATLDDLLHKTSLGSLVLWTQMRPGQESRANLDEFGLRDIGVITLSNEREFSDFLEFQFERPLLEHNCQLLEMLGPVLAQSWCDRAPGIVATRLAGRPFPTAAERSKKCANILGSDNPAKLTRSEFRICMLVQEGSLPDDLAEILHVSKSTFRSHMRAIYFKTGVSGHVELVYLLHGAGGLTSDEPLQNSLRH